MTRVILESPYRGGDSEKITENKVYACLCLSDSLDRGESPMSSHLLYTQVLDDTDPEQRAIGIEAGQAWYEVAEYCVVYTDLEISDGMKEGIKFAESKGLTIRYRKLYG